VSSRRDGPFETIRIPVYAKLTTPPPLPRPERVNQALKKPASASASPEPKSDPKKRKTNPSLANDGKLNTDWTSSEEGADRAWWQVDLETPVKISGLEIGFLMRPDEPLGRRKFEVQASNDPAFTTPTVLATAPEAPIPHGKRWSAEISTSEKFRYLRVIKTQPGERLSLAEVRVYSDQ
jgi:hypothetical protein